MDPNAEVLYSVEQITVPDALPALMKEWGKAVLKEKPADIVAFSAA